MEKNYSVSLKDSIATHLFKTVFALYIIVATGLTIVHVLSEYREAKVRIKANLVLHEQAVQEVLAKLLWNFDQEKIPSTMHGLLKFPSILGMQVTSSDKSIDIKMGAVSDLNGIVHIYDDHGARAQVFAGLFERSGLIQHVFPIIAREKGYKSQRIGRAVLYSSNLAIFNVLKYELSLILFISLIKTCALWLIFLWFSRKIISKPLARMTQATATLNLTRLAGNKIEPPSHKKDELFLLTLAFNGMVDKINRTLEKNRKVRVALKTLNQELEERVQARTSELEAANKGLESYNYSVSHDLRNPLLGIGGFTKILQEDYSNNLGEQGRHYLDRVQASVERMGQIIQSLMEISRVTSLNLRHSQVDLSQMAREIMDDILARAPATARKVEILIAPNLICHADQRLMRTVLENLLENAWKYSEKNESVKIEFSVEGRGKKREFYIRDNGAGFNMRHVGRIFEPFRRLHTNKQFQGHGVGLATVHRIILRHGGVIRAEGEPDKGAVFYFSIPG